MDFFNDDEEWLAPPRYTIASGDNPATPNIQDLDDLNDHVSEYTITQNGNPATPNIQDLDDLYDHVSEYTIAAGDNPATPNIQDLNNFDDRVPEYTIASGETPNIQDLNNFDDRVPEYTIASVQDLDNFSGGFTNWLGVEDLEDKTNDLSKTELFSSHLVAKVGSLLPELHNKLSAMIEEQNSNALNGEQFDTAFTKLTQDEYGHVYEQISKGFYEEESGADILDTLGHGLQDMLDDETDNLDELVGFADEVVSTIKEVNTQEVSQGVEVHNSDIDQDFTSMMGQDII